MRFRGLAIGVGVVAILLVLDFEIESVITDSSIRNLLYIAACNVLAALSLNVINGMAGQFSIGHAGFIALGAYTSAVVGAHLNDAIAASQLHTTDPTAIANFEPTFANSFLVMPVCLLASALVAGLFGLMVGLPSLRLRGDYLAIVTLGFAEVVRLVISTANPTTINPATGLPETIGEAWHAVRGLGSFFHALSLTVNGLGGENGYMGTNTNGLPLYAGPFWVFGMTILVAIGAWRLKFSSWGRALRALREDEIASAAVGVDPTRYKVTSFVISAVGASVAGCMLAMMHDGTGSVNPGDYKMDKSFEIITMVILGGSGSISGAILGALFVTFTVKFIEYFQGTSAGAAIRGPHDLGFTHLTVDLNALRMMIYAALLVAVVISRPEGLFGERELSGKQILRFFKRTLRRLRGLSPESAK
ncbi:ABC transporter ATP-binding protein [soil metagenome]